MEDKDSTTATATATRTATATATPTTTSPTRTSRRKTKAATAAETGSTDKAPATAPREARAKMTDPTNAKTRSDRNEETRTKLLELKLKRRENRYNRTRIDTTRGQRIIDAMAAMPQIPHDAENTFHSYKYASGAAIYRAVNKVLGKCGLEIRTKLINIEVTQDLNMKQSHSRHSDKENAATMRLELAFGLAGPDDGPDAPLSWEHSVLYAPMRDIQSQGAMRKYMRRYWLSDKFLIGTGETGEIDSQHGNETSVSGSAATRTDKKYQQAAESYDRGRSQTGGLSPAEDAEHDQWIDRGVRALELTQDQETEVFKRCRDDKRAVLAELTRMFHERENAREHADTKPESPAAATAGEATPTAAAGDSPSAAAASADARTDAAGTDAGATAATAEQATTPTNGDKLALTMEDQAWVARETAKAGIPNDTARRIVRSNLNADSMAEVTLAQLDRAAADAGLKLPTDTPPRNIAAALIRRVAIDLENAQSDNGRPADPGDSELDPSPRPVSPADTSDAHTYGKMADEADKTLTELNPELAKSLRSRRYRNHEERLQTIETAVATERAKPKSVDGGAAAAADAMTQATATMSKPRASKTAPTPAPTPPAEATTSSQTEAVPLTIKEQIKFMIHEHNLSDVQVNTLKQIARDDDEVLLETIERFVQSG